MNKFLIFLLVFSFTLPKVIVADNVSRPNANNKMNISKKTLDEKENSFFSRLLKGDFDYGSSEHSNENIIKQINEGNKSIKGIMLESNINEGSQSINLNYNDPSLIKYGVSLTDSCVGIQETEELLVNFIEATN